MYESYSKESVTHRVIEKCKEVNYEFLGFVEWLKSKSQLILKCNIHNVVWKTTTANYFLKTGGGCNKCSALLIGKSIKKSDEDMSISFMKSGKFLEGTKFWRSSERNKSKTYRWFYRCPKCSNDEYVKAGLCSGIFNGSNAANLQRGKLSCRCSNNFPYTDEQRQLKIQNVLDLEGESNRFIRWTVSNSGWSNKALILCPKHGFWEGNMSYFRLGGARCSGCTKYGFNKDRDAYIYIIKVSGKTGDFTGFGITGNSDERLKVHKRELGRFGYSIIDRSIFKCTGVKAIDIEKEIKYNFPVLPQEVDGFKKESTYYDLYEVLIKFVEDKLTGEYNECI